MAGRRSLTVDPPERIPGLMSDEVLLAEAASTRSWLDELNAEVLGARHRMGRLGREINRRGLVAGQVRAPSPVLAGRKRRPKQVEGEVEE
ncbi:hypothetical protein ACFY2K_42815 [Kitasatospora sp. NPDC001309]|uniref:hypothetical protein n=1 Tax=Kitasatospora sp. NPDC001309 TaxID=3364013 RepID=UPI00369E6100